MRPNESLQIMQAQTLINCGVDDVDVCNQAAIREVTGARRILAGISSDSPKLAILRNHLDAASRSLDAITLQVRELQKQVRNLEPLALSPNTEDTFAQMYPGSRSLSSL